MEGEISPSNRIQDGDDELAIIVAEDSKGEPLIGDVIWVKLSGGSWWPALIVDKLKEDVRVRLYGTYEYMLVNPIEWRSEFQLILEQNNGSYREIFRKALDKDFSSSKYGQRKMSKSRGKSDERVTKERTNRNNGRSSKKIKLDSPKTEGNSNRKSSKKKLKLTSDSDEELTGRSQELSARRIKVMQTLGLAAPSGSPFHKIKTFI